MNNLFSYYIFQYIIWCSLNISRISCNLNFLKWIFFLIIYMKYHLIADAFIENLIHYVSNLHKENMNEHLWQYLHLLSSIIHKEIYKWISFYFNIYSWNVSWTILSIHAVNIYSWNVFWTILSIHAVNIHAVNILLQALL